MPWNCFDLSGCGQCFGISERSQVTLACRKFNTPHRLHMGLHWNQVSWETRNRPIPHTGPHRSANLHKRTQCALHERPQLTSLSQLFLSALTFHSKKDLSQTHSLFPSSQVSRTDRWWQAWPQAPKHFGRQPGKAWLPSKRDRDGCESHLIFTKPCKA